MDQFQLRCKNVEIRASRVFDFNIVFDFVVNLDLLDSSIDSESVILMNHIISDVERGKTLNLFSFIRAVALFLLALRAKDVRLRDDRELQNRIFIALMHLTVADHNLSRQ